MARTTVAARGAGLLVLLAGALLVVFAAHVWLAVNNPHVGLLADDALYLLMADIYSPWRQAEGAIYDHVRAISHLPPVFPLYLGMLGGGADAIATARVGSALAMALACLLVYAIGRQLGWGRPVAAWATLYVALAPSTLLYVIDVWSEGLYLALSLAALVLAYTAARTPRSWPHLVLLGMLVACAIGTRTIGVALVPAVLWALRERGVRVVLGVGAVIVVAHLTVQTLALGDYSQSYGNLIARTYFGDPVAALFAQLRTVINDAPGAYTQVLMQLPSPAPWQWLLIGPSVPLVVIGYAREIQRRSPLAVYLTTYLGIAALWPFPDQLGRFLYPLLPLFLYLMIGGANLLQHGKWIARSAMLMLMAVMLSVTAGFAARAMTPIPDAALASWRTTRYWLDPSRGADPLPGLRGRAAYVEAARLAGRLVPADACIHTLHLHVVYIVARRPAIRPPNPDALAKGEDLACSYFLAVADSIDGLPPLYPLDLLPGPVEMLAVIRVAVDGESSANDPIAAVLFRWPVAVSNPHGASDAR